MNISRLICLIFALLALVICDPLFARGGHGKGRHASGSFRSFSGGARHFGGGRHLGRGHYGFSGRHRYFRGRHRYNRFSFGLGLGYYFPGFYGYRSLYRPPFYGYSPYYLGAATTMPVVYIQREETTLSRSDCWHYCMSSEGYYPNTRRCPEGWLQVLPRSSEQ